MKEKTLLDEFAMAALTGILTNEKLMGRYMQNMYKPDQEAQVAIISYRFANIMMRERKNQ